LAALTFDGELGGAGGRAGRQTGDAAGEGTGAGVADDDRAVARGRADDGAELQVRVLGHGQRANDGDRTRAGGRGRLGEGRGGDGDGGEGGGGGEGLEEHLLSPTRGGLLRWRTNHPHSGQSRPDRPLERVKSNQSYRFGSNKVRPTGFNMVTLA